jgi:hypothetical protein
MLKDDHYRKLENMMHSAPIVRLTDSGQRNPILRACNKISGTVSRSW